MTERIYTWQDASQVARSDPEIDLDSKDGKTYLPGAYEDEVLEETLAKEAEEHAKQALKEEKKAEEAEKVPS